MLNAGWGAEDAGHVMTNLRGAGSATAELQQEPLLVKLDNKGVVEHFRSTMGGLETRMRRQVSQHARGLWNLLQAVTAYRPGQVWLEWLRARHNQLDCEDTADGQANDLVDGLARHCP